MSDRQEDNAHDSLSRVTDWLLVGGEIATAEHMTRLAAHGVTTVISAACEVSDRALGEQHRLGCYHLCWYDDQHDWELAPTAAPYSVVMSCDLVEDWPVGQSHTPFAQHLVRCARCYRQPAVRAAAVDCQGRR
jgi:hypothetical protein